MVTVSGDCCPHAVIAYIHRATGTATKAGENRRMIGLLLTTSDLHPYGIENQWPGNAPRLFIRAQASQKRIDWLALFSSAK